MLVSAEASLDELRLGAIGLKSALGIETCAVNVHLSLVAFHCVLVKTVKFRVAFTAQLTPSTVVFKELRAIPHQFGGLLRDFWLKIEFFRFFMSLKSPLKV